ncbi:MAG: S41 family peptidase [Planctomycetota bacterium]|jgi:carboxyl-terminal processing protease|nr:S41 family peptidase [Planctomycetota bacterium]
MSTLRPLLAWTLLIAFLCPTPGQADKTAKILIVTQPEGAHIRLDDEYVGETRKDPFKVEPGSVRVVIIKEKHLVEVRTVEARDGETVKLDIQLTPDITPPYPISIKNAPKLIEQEFEAITLPIRAIQYLTQAHPMNPDGNELLAESVRTIAYGLNKLRERESLLQKHFSPEIRKEFYGEEEDIRDYPEIKIEETQYALGYRFQVTVGDKSQELDLSMENPTAAAATLRTFLEFLDSAYDTQKKISRDAYAHMLLAGIIGKVGDDFTYLMPPRAIREMEIENKQSLGGLGMQVSKNRRGIEVIAPIEDTPAAKAGILAGDIIVQIGETSTQDMELNKAVSILRGEPGTPVTITIWRESAKKKMVMTLNRALYKIRFLRWNLREDKIGYMRLASFSGTKIAQEMEVALREMLSQGMEGLIIDLRNNPGGLLVTALNVLNLFLEEGIVVEIRARIPQFSETHRAKKDGTLQRFPISVLINKGSASASEILAGCLQDVGRAKVIGVTSYGKGSVQRVINLTQRKYGPHIALTVAYYFTSGKRKIHKIGVKPDIEIPLTPEQELEISRRSIYKSAEKAEDPQLARAVEVLKEEIAAKR